MRTPLVLAVIFLVGGSAFSDEGMWPYNNFPTDALKQRYGSAPTQDWLDHVRLSSLRIAGGCSASFVSPNGLVMTNHHCAHRCIEQLSTGKNDHVKNGFFARTDKEEVACPAMEMNQLMAIADVTARVEQAKQNVADDKLHDAIRAEIAKIEKECATSDELRCEVVSLYHGGRYDLYTYRRYQDVRLVFAPEFATAFFGGDPDNFMFPRWDLDVTFVRVYKDGKPLKTDHWLRWTKDGVKAGDPVFVSGNPGRTSRLKTVAQLEYDRDLFLPTRLGYLNELRGYVAMYQTRGPEQKRHSTDKLFGIENSVKGLTGRHRTLADPRFFAALEAAEKDLRQKVDADPALRAAYGGAWDAVAKVTDKMRRYYDETWAIELETSDLFGYARTLVRGAEELPKPNGQRLEEFTDSRLPELKQRLFSTAPVHDELETALLAFQLTKMRQVLGPDHPVIKRILGQKAPAEVAAALVKRTTLKDPKVRRALWDAGKVKVDATKDPMLDFVRSYDADARAVRKRWNGEIDGPLKKYGGLLAQARFKLYGAGQYPDATFTLRLSFGTVKGWTEPGSEREVKPFTYLAGAYDRATGRDPFALPATWLAARTKLKLDTPLDFTADTDIIGGNSGSPVVGKDGDVVGLVFDGNIQSLGGEYAFDAAVNRTVAVDARAIVEALGKIYGAQRLVDELTSSRP